MVLKSIPKSKFLTFFGLPVHSALRQRANFIFPSSNRTFCTPWSSFEKFSIKKIFIKNHCISPRYDAFSNRGRTPLYSSVTLDQKFVKCNFKTIKQNCSLTRYYFMDWCNQLNGVGFIYSSDPVRKPLNPINNRWVWSC